jgi:hypothetical protein
MAELNHPRRSLRTELVRLPSAERLILTPRWRSGVTPHATWVTDGDAAEVRRTRRARDLDGFDGCGRRLG